MQRNRHTIFQHPARTEAEAEALDGFGREAEASNEKQAEIDRVKGELAKVKAKIDRLNTAFADGSLEMDEFKEMKNPLVPVKTGCEQKLAELERSKLNRLEPLKTFIFQANQSKKCVEEESWQEMRSYFKKRFEPHFECSNLYRHLQNTRVFIGCRVVLTTSENGCE